MSSRPANWPKPNYVNPETLGAGIPVVLVLLLVTTVAVLGVRLWTRHQLRQFALDDVLIVISVILTIGAHICQHLAFFNYGRRVHAWDVPPTDTVGLLKVIFVSIQFYVWGMFCSKLSILVFYRRLITRISNRRFRITNIALMTFLCLGTIAISIAQIIPCNPVHAYWNSSDKNWKGKYTCWKGSQLSDSTAAFSITTDFLITVFPLWFMRNLQMSLNRKWPLVLVFSLGFLTCSVGIARLFVLYAKADNRWTNDWAWFGAIALALQVIEQTMAAFCACAPALKVFFNRRQLTGAGSGRKSSRSGGSFPHLSGKFSQRSRTHESKLPPSHDDDDIELGQNAQPSPNGGTDENGTKSEKSVSRVHLVPLHAVRKEVKIDVVSSPV